MNTTTDLEVIDHKCRDVVRAHHARIDELEGRVKDLTNMVYKLLLEDFKDPEIAKID